MPIWLNEIIQVLKPSEHQTEQEALEIAITKLLLKSYYVIVRKNVEDSVPKAIMHFLACMHKLPVESTMRGSHCPYQWPLRLEKAPYWLESQVGVYGKPAKKDFVANYDMRSYYGGSNKAGADTFLFGL
ncbi:Dynamin-related protein 3A [Carex littledalei]|uniref:Dynamin-related protein 3A n=1 Tax=Carex littledalei TaxID=544730 RepID=A0A833V223_9POAL|nr:Dynamin-related protein 3A [Carex littledalei]